MGDRSRIVIEVDGKHHYADGDTASPARYAEMVAEDRKLRLAGYEVYRFDAQLDQMMRRARLEQGSSRLLAWWGAASSATS